MDDRTLPALDTRTADDSVDRNTAARLHLQADLLDAIGEAVVAADNDGCVVYLNDAACRAGGVDLREVIGRPAVTLVPSGHPFAQLLGPVTADDSERRSVTARISSATGAEVDALLQRSVLVDATGATTGFVVVGVNVTRRLEAEGLADDRALQHAVIARMSQLALQKPGVASLFEAAAQATAETLGADLAAVFELVENDQMLMRAAVGFPAGSVGRASVPSAQLRTLDAVRSSGETGPAAVPFSAELLFGADDIVCGMRSAIVVDGEPFGCLEVQCRHERGFCAETEVNFLRTMANLLAAAIVRQRLDEEVVRAEEHERRRISDDIHDDTLQAVLAVALQIEALQHTLHDPDQRAAAGRAVAAAREAAARLRTLMFDLSPDDLDEKGLEDALGRMGAQAAADFGCAFAVRGSLTAPVSSDDKIVLFRVAREAVVNAGKHARAANLWVTVATVDGGTSVTVEDDGVGITPAAGRDFESGHTGLARMRDRLTCVGGRWSIEARQAGGTRVMFWLPNREAEPTEAAVPGKDGREVLPPAGFSAPLR